MEFFIDNGDFVAVNGEMVEEIKRHVENVLKLKVKPDQKILGELSALTFDEYFEVVDVIDRMFIQVDFP